MKVYLILNNTHHTQMVCSSLEKAKELLREMLKEIGPGLYIVEAEVDSRSFWEQVI